LRGKINMNGNNKGGLTFWGVVGAIVVAVIILSIG
jgi:hypothetical protein